MDLCGAAIVRRRSSRRGFTLVELLVVIAVIGVLVGLLLPAIQAAREAARRSQCSNNLRQLALALQNYHAQHGAFPAGARLHQVNNQPGVSWRVLTLPFIEQAPLYEQINPLPDGGAEDWSPQKTTVAALICPSADPPSQDAQDLKESHYAAGSGAGRDEERIDLEDIVCGDVDVDGVLYVVSRVKATGITDGTSNTLLLGERTYIWRDWMSGATKTGNPPTRICTGASKNIRYPINADPWQFGFFVGHLQAPEGAPRTMLLNDLQFASEHPGGAHFALADGSVHFVGEELDFTVFQDLSTRDGGESTGALP
jgi:prepilin-type N-terminal cleavage/methylation domain-containing protein/prepilin-type processing-associated H-X9-DG protein